MTEKEKLNLLVDLQALKTMMGKEIDKIHKVFNTYDFKLLDVHYKTYDMLVELVADKLGDTTNFLFWHIYENDWGLKKLSVIIADKEWHISSNRKFLQCLALENNLS